jgi:cyanophycin synthetase
MRLKAMECGMRSEGQESWPGRASAHSAGAAADQHQQGTVALVRDGNEISLRPDVISICGVNVIVDMARSCATYAALAKTARAMASRQVIAVVSAPGDKNNDDLVEIGKVCAAGFDDLVIFEAENCGRALGDTARLITQGAREAVTGHGRLHCKLDVRRAVRFGLQMCKPGDLLVLGCSTSFGALLHAVRT